MALRDTQLYIQMAALPATFKGSPADLAIAMIQRMKIVSPTGTSFIFTGDTEPTSNVGPWLKGGTQWYVWDENTKRYIPQDITASETIWYFIGASVPTSTASTLWLRTSRDATDIDPSHGAPVGWYLFDGTIWVPFNGVVTSGPTAARPAAPIDFQQFYDTSIATLIWWERGAWRTVSGVPGDVKFVYHQFLTDALRANPGWTVVGETSAQFRGRYFSQATTDGVTTLAAGTNITARTVYDTFGDTSQYTDTSPAGTHIPGGLALWALVKQ